MYLKLKVHWGLAIQQLMFEKLTDSTSTNSYPTFIISHLNLLIRYSRHPPQLSDCHLVVRSGMVREHHPMSVVSFTFTIQPPSNTDQPSMERD